MSLEWWTNQTQYPHLFSCIYQSYKATQITQENNLSYESQPCRAERNPIGSCTEYFMENTFSPSVDKLFLLDHVSYFVPFCSKYHYSELSYWYCFIQECTQWDLKLWGHFNFPAFMVMFFNFLVSFSMVNFHSDFSFQEKSLTFLFWQ